MVKWDCKTCPNTSLYKTAICGARLLIFRTHFHVPTCALEVLHTELGYITTTTTADRTGSVNLWLTQHLTHYCFKERGAARQNKIVHHFMASLRGSGPVTPRPPPTTNGTWYLTRNNVVGEWAVVEECGSYLDLGNEDKTDDSTDGKTAWLT